MSVRRLERPAELLGAVLSVALHGLVVVALAGWMERPASREQITPLEWVSSAPPPAAPVEAPPLPPEPAPDPEVAVPPPPPSPRLSRRRASPTEPTAPEASEEVAASADAPFSDSPPSNEQAVAESASRTNDSPTEPVDFTGLTLTRSGAGGWNVPLGDGRGGSGRVGPMPRRPGARSGDGPIVAPAPSSTRRRAPRRTGPSAQRRLAPPGSLDSALERAYPPNLRAAGVEGSVVLRVDVDVDGRVRVRGVERSDHAAFAEACRQVLEESTWSPELDDDGVARARSISFTCRFRIRER